MMRCHLDWVLRISETVSYLLTNLDLIQLRPSNGVVLREFNLRSSTPYPQVPFTPGQVSFASAVGDTQRRFNSYML